MRVLIVEDEARMAALIRQGLEEEAYAVDVVENGRDSRLFVPIGLKITRVRSLNQIIFAFLAHYMLPLFFHADESNIFFEATL